MLNQIYICSENSKQTLILSDEFKSIELIKVIELSWEEYLKSNLFNIINFPNLMAVDLFHAIIKNLNSEILSTNRQYDIPEYIVTTPVFLNETMKITNEEKFKYLAEIPFRKVIEFSKEIESKIVYGIHTRLLFTYLDFNISSVKALRQIFCSTLHHNNLMK